jgi:hypothetical protein
MTSMLLSYRRADSEAMTGRIFERLVAYYGGDSIFMDIHKIPLGVDYRTFLKDEIVKHDFVLVIVGPRWRGVGENGSARIEDADDPVRMEVEAALAGQCRTIPILTGGAIMPKPPEVPKTLEPILLPQWRDGRCRAGFPRAHEAVDRPARTGAPSARRRGTDYRANCRTPEELGMGRRSRSCRLRERRRGLW